MSNTAKILSKLTNKEEEILNYFWDQGPLFIRELLALQDEPKPHFNTLSTIVRSLKEKGYIAHRAYGSNFQYYAIVSREEFKALSLKNVINKYYDNSIFSAISSLVKEEKISEKELKELLDLVNNSQD